MKLKELRLKYNLRQEDLAKRLNKTKSGYGYYESGRTEPDIETLCKLADIYHVSIDELVGRNFNIQLSEQEEELLNYMRQLSPIEQGKVIGYAKSRVDYNKQQKEKILYKNLKEEENI